jgi:hypothetical protein
VWNARLELSHVDYKPEWLTLLDESSFLVAAFGGRNFVATSESDEGRARCLRRSPCASRWECRVQDV